MQRTIPANYFTLADIEYLEGARLPNPVVSIGNKTKVVPSRYRDQIGSTETDFRKCCELRPNPTLSAVKIPFNPIGWRGRRLFVVSSPLIFGPLSSVAQALSFVASSANEVFNLAISVSMSALKCSTFASPIVFRS